MSKEIRGETEDLKKRLSEVRNAMEELPLNPKDRLIWEDNLKKFESLTTQINNKIDKYNLLVPILQKQMLHINLNELAEKALSVPPVRPVKRRLDSRYENPNRSISQDLFTFISDLFSKKIS